MFEYCCDSIYSFLFQADKSGAVQKHAWTGGNDYFMLSESDFMAIGGGYLIIEGIAMIILFAGTASLHCILTAISIGASLRQHRHLPTPSRCVAALTVNLSASDWKYGDL
jgi:hypothetical protein